jgi:pyridoxal phosphate-dependent aminotransferase EpsN
LAGKVTRRRDHYRAYQKAFAPCPGIVMQPEASWGESTHWLSCLTIDPTKAGATTDDVRLALEKLDIEARPIWKPLHLQPVFAGAEYFGGQVAEGLFAQGLCLPSGSGMSVEDRDRVIAGVKSVLK